MLSWYCYPETYDFPRSIFNFDFQCSGMTLSYTAFSIVALASLPTNPEVRRAGIYQKVEGPWRSAYCHFGHVCSSSQSKPLELPVGIRTAAIIWSVRFWSKKTWETRRWIETYWMVRPRLVELCFSLSRGTCRCRGFPEYLNLLPGLVSKEIPASSSLRMNSEFSDRLANRLVISFQRTESEGLDSPFIRASLRMPRFTCCWWN